MNPLKMLFTGKDNTTYDLGRVSWALSMISVIGHDVWEMAKGRASIKDLAIAISAVVAAHGFALGMKDKTEPEAK